jgi:hypothetical protein
VAAHAGAAHALIAQYRADARYAEIASGPLYAFRLQ